MTAKKTGRVTRKRRRVGEPRVPIDRIRLQKALDDSLIPSRKELARQLNENQQSISDLFNKQKTCYESLLKEIADLLKVPVTYLIAGEGDRIRFQPSDEKSTTEAQFVYRCYEAFRHDRTRCRTEEEREQRERSEEEFRSAIYTLLRPQFWWKHLLVPVRDDRPDRDSYWQLLRENDDDPTDEEADHRVAAAIAAALDLILAPWFHGLAKLDYEKIVQLVYPSDDDKRKRG